MFPIALLFFLSVLSPQTVLELFYQTVARKYIISQIYSQSQNDTELLQWQHMVSNVVHLLAQLLYPSTQTQEPILLREIIMFGSVQSVYC